MKRALRSVSLGLLSISAMWDYALASPRELEKGVLFEDFEDGKLDAWEIEGDHAEIEAEFGNAVLEVGGGSKLWLKGETFKDFSLEARVRRTYQAAGGDVGFVFRDKYRLYIRMSGELKLDGPGIAASRGLSRGVNTDRYRTLKMVCAGPVVRYYVDGEYEGEADNIAPAGGRIALFGGSKAMNVYLDDVKITNHVSPGEYLAAEPQAPDDCLVFSPREDVKLSFRVSNFSDVPQQAEVGIWAGTWGGVLLRERQSGEIALNAGEKQTVTFELGRLPAGFHKMLVKPSNRLLPLAIQERGSGEYKRPDIVIGGYWYYRHWDLPAVWWKTYVHAAARQLVDNHFNMVVNHIGMPTETMDILRQYGISCLSRGEHLDHPAVLGAFLSDEPKAEDIPKLKEQYVKAHEKAPDKILTTCMIGDGGLRGHVFDAWKELVPLGKIAMFRWYGIKKCWEGIERQRDNRPAFTEILRQAREPGHPFWVILPSFGTDDADAYFGNPLPSQITAMMHLAIANGAQGLVFYTYQNPGGPNGYGFVESTSLVPADGKWAAAGDVAGKIARVAKLLKTLKCTGAVPSIDDDAIEGYQLEGETSRYFYLVNKDSRRAVNFRLFRLEPKGKMVDLYAERDVPIYPETVELLRPGTTIDTGVVHLSLNPGQGTFLRYSPQGEGAAAAPPRAKYPAWVDQLPEGQRQYLIDVQPSNKPMPGWVPGHDYDANPWHKLNGDTQLYASMDDPGQEYKRSLYAQAETTIVYKLPDGWTHFVAAAGLGTKHKKSSVIFRVLVDGKEKFRSDIYRLGDPILPVVVDMAGAKEMQLITEEAGDGLYNDYAWWGEARWVKKP